MPSPVYSAGDALFEEHFHELHEGGDDQDEGDRAQVFQVVGHQHVPLHQPGDDARQHQHEHHGHGHAGGGFHLLGGSQERAVAQVLDQQDVVDQHTAEHEDGKITEHGRLLFLPKDVHDAEHQPQTDEGARGFHQELERLEGRPPAPRSASRTA